VNQFTATVRRHVKSGVETFSGKVRLDGGPVVFKVAEFESQQIVQAEIAGWIKRQGKGSNTVWNYA
jgi:hypothetical protein